MPGRRGTRNTGNGSNTPPLPKSPKSKKLKVDRETIPEFDPIDFHGWAFQMKVLLSATDCYGAIDHVSNQWATRSPEKKEKMANTASLYINLSLGKDYRHICSNFEPSQAKDLYEKIKNMYLKDDIQTRMHLTAKLTEFAWTTDDHVDSFLGKIANIRTSYKNANVYLDETELFCRMLNKLPQEFDLLRLIMQGWANPDFDRARVVLLQYQEDLRKKKKFAHEHPLRNPDSSAYIMDGKRKRETERDEDREKKRKNFICMYCWRTGHAKRNCYVREDDLELGIDRDCMPDNELPSLVKERKEKYELKSKQSIGGVHVVQNEKEDEHIGTSSSFKIVDDPEDGWSV